MSKTIVEETLAAIHSKLVCRQKTPSKDTVETRSKSRSLLLSILILISYPTSIKRKQIIRNYFLLDVNWHQMKHDLGISLELSFLMYLSSFSLLIHNFSKAIKIGATRKG